VRLLLAKGADVHAEKDEALRRASMLGHTETVKLLLAKGANPLADGAMIWAREKGHTDIVKELRKAAMVVVAGCASGDQPPPRQPNL
jgi:ankyrin repeat protein